MKVFVSWSKDASRAVAIEFAKWLPDVIQEADVYISTETTKGDAWFETIHKNLADSTVGVLFITPMNKDEPWLNYEAGALRTLPTAKRLCSVFVGMKTADYQGPMKGFQMTHFSDQDDMLKMVETINDGADRPLGKERLEKQFNLRWPALEEATKGAVKTASTEAVPPREPAGPRTVEDKIDEILDLLRDRNQDNPFVYRAALPVIGETPARPVPKLGAARQAFNAFIASRDKEAFELSARLHGRPAYRDEFFVGYVQDVVYNRSDNVMDVVVSTSEGRQGYAIDELEIRDEPS